MLLNARNGITSGIVVKHFKNNVTYLKFMHVQVLNIHVPDMILNIKHNIILCTF